MTRNDMADGIEEIRGWLEDAVQHLKVLQEKAALSDRQPDTYGTATNSRKKHITINQASVIAGKSVSTIRRWVNVYGLGHRVGGQWHIDREKFEKFLEK